MVDPHEGLAVGIEEAPKRVPLDAARLAASGEQPRRAVARRPGRLYAGIGARWWRQARQVGPQKGSQAPHGQLGLRPCVGEVDLEQSLPRHDAANEDGGTGKGNGDGEHSRAGGGGEGGDDSEATESETESGEGSGEGGQEEGGDPDATESETESGEERSDAPSMTIAVYEVRDRRSGRSEEYVNCVQ